MTEEKKEIASEASDQNAPKEDNSAAAPAENKEAEEIKDLDPRVVEIVGKDKIQSAFSEQPEEDGKPTEEKKEIPKEESQKENQENKAEGKEEQIPAITPPEPKPTRLDRRLAGLYIRNLHLSGEEKIPTEEEVLADLKKYSKEEKIQALHFHRLKGKELRGEKPTGDDLDDEDREAIQDAERESIRQEVLAEEHARKVQENFVEFVGNHTELLPDDDDNKKNFPEKKPYDSVLAEAVETLWKGGMPIDKAYKTVTDQIQAVKNRQEAEEKKKKNKSLSGVLSGSGQVPRNTKELDWDDVAKIQEENPELYKRMLAEGKFKHLM